MQIVSSNEYINPVLQNLCADALLSLSDEDSDWELNITEFMRCLDPGEFKKCYISVASVLDPGSSRLGSSLVQGHCVLGQDTLLLQFRNQRLDVLKGHGPLKA